MQDYFLWCSQMVDVMAAEESFSDVTTADLQLAQHQQLWAEIEARQETYQQAVDMGEELTQDRNNRKEVRSTLDVQAIMQSVLQVLSFDGWWFTRWWRSWMACRWSGTDWSSSGTRSRAG